MTASRRTQTWFAPGIPTDNAGFEHWPCQVRLNDWVTLKAANGTLKTVQVQDKSTNIVFGKINSFKSSLLLGKLFGLTYEFLPDGSLSPKEDLPITTIEDTDATNENIAHSAGAQGLSAEAIKLLKAEGAHGRDIIAKQIEEHAAFALKNEHSKAKYIARKESKYLKYFTILPPTVHCLCDTEFASKQKEATTKTREMRPDTLAQMLNYANCEPGSRILCVDETSGLLPGAILSRLGGEGSLLAITDTDSPPSHPLLPFLNLPDEILAPMQYLNWAHATQDYQAAEEVPEAAEGVSDKARRKLSKRKDILQQVEKRRQVLFEGEWDALLISSPYDATSVVDFLQPYLAGSANLVVHSLFVEPLVALQHHLKSTRAWISINISEGILRKYQVLPGRAHPEMQGTGPAGYLLRAIFVTNGDVEAPLRPPKRAKKSKTEGDAP